LLYIYQCIRSHIIESSNFQNYIYAILFIFITNPKNNSFWRILFQTLVGYFQLYVFIKLLKPRGYFKCQQNQHKKIYFVFPECIVLYVLQKNSDNFPIRALSNMVPMSNCARQRSPVDQVQCRATIDIMLHSAVS
jgi:hypothetical protein